MATPIKSTVPPTTSTIIRHAPRSSCVAIDSLLGGSGVSSSPTG